MCKNSQDNYEKEEQGEIICLSNIKMIYNIMIINA